MVSAVWLVRSHQIAADLRFWLTYIGYDRHDHSLSHKIYLVYASIFFSWWGFATLALLATFAGGLLKGLAGMLAASGPSAGLEHAAVGMLGLVMLGWWLYRGFSAGRASPMTFSEDDAALICQTPVSRPAVALLWLLGDWIKSGPFFWALAVTLAFALQDAALGAGGSAVLEMSVPRYVLAGIRALSLALPVQWGLMASAWAWGALRLERDRIRLYWWAGPLVLAAVLLGAMVVSGGLLPGLFRGVGAAVTTPLIFPLAAGYNLAGWGLGLAAGAGWALLGSLALALAARHLNLSRAAQETTGRSASETAAQAGNTQAVAEIALRRRLGMGHSPTHLAARSAWQALIWKGALSWDRRGGLAAVAPILVIFIAGLAISLAMDWGTRTWATLAWLVAVEQFTARPLVEDLQLWPLFRALPFSTRQALLGGLALPWALVVVLGLLAAGVAALVSEMWLPFSAPFTWLVLLVPGAALSSGLAAAVDVLRSARSSQLMNGQAPLPGTTGVLIGGLALGLAALAVQLGGGGALGSLLGGLAAAGTAWLILGIAADKLGNIE